MAEIQTLIEMGFPKERAWVSIVYIKQICFVGYDLYSLFLFIIIVIIYIKYDYREKALAVTNYKGVEPAMEWLLAHADDPSMQTEASSSQAPVGSTTEHSDSATTDDATEQNEDAKSFKCDECGKLLKDQDEMEFHAAKTNHSSFSESTEEKKPLTEEEKKAQLALLEERMKQKRKEREEREKVLFKYQLYFWHLNHILSAYCFEYNCFIHFYYF